MSARQIPRFDWEERILPDLRDLVPELERMGDDIDQNASLISAAGETAAESLAALEAADAAASACIDALEARPSIVRVASTGGAVDLTSSTEQTITLAHGLPSAPSLQDCAASLHGAGGPVGWSMDYMHVSSVDETSVVVKVKLGTPAASGTLDVTVMIYTTASG